MTEKPVALLSSPAPTERTKLMGRISREDFSDALRKAIGDPSRSRESVPSTPSPTCPTCGSSNKNVRNRLTQDRRGIDFCRDSWHVIRANPGVPSTPVETSANACQGCGRNNPVWFTPNEIWNRVIPSRRGFLCPICFIERADKVIPNTGWMLTPENDATPVETASRWELILERERTQVAEGVKAIRDAVIHRDWLTEGRGPYEWNDDNWHAEFAAASKEILTALKPLEKIAADLSDCPTKWKDVLAAREELESQLTQVLAKHAEEFKELDALRSGAKNGLLKYMLAGDVGNFSDRMRQLLQAENWEGMKTCH